MPVEPLGSHHRLCITRVVLTCPADLREDLVRNPPLEGLALWLPRPKRGVIESRLVDVNGFALVVVLRVGGGTFNVPPLAASLCRWSSIKDLELGRRGEP